MNNAQYRLRAAKSQILESSTVVGFRVSKPELEKLKEIQNTLRTLGIKCTTSDTLRIILKYFNIESWKKESKTQLQIYANNKCG